MVLGELSFCSLTSHISCCTVLEKVLNGDVATKVTKEDVEACKDMLNQLDKCDVQYFGSIDLDIE